MTSEQAIFESSDAVVMHYALCMQCICMRMNECVPNVLHKHDVVSLDLRVGILQSRSLSRPRLVRVLFPLAIDRPSRLVLPN